MEKQCLLHEAFEGMRGGTMSIAEAIEYAFRAQELD